MVHADDDGDVDTDCDNNDDDDGDDYDDDDFLVGELKIRQVYMKWFELEDREKSEGRFLCSLLSHLFVIPLPDSSTTSLLFLWLVRSERC